jgi:hypothetical protein
MFPGLILHKTQKQNTQTEVSKKPWAPPGPWLLALPVGPRWLHLPLVYAAISATHRASIQLTLYSRPTRGKRST